MEKNVIFLNHSGRYISFHKMVDELGFAFETGIYGEENHSFDFVVTYEEAKEVISEMASMLEREVS